MCQYYTSRICADVQAFTHTQADTLQYTQSHTWWFVALKILPRQQNGFIGGMINDALPLQSA